MGPCECRILYPKFVVGITSRFALKCPGKGFERERLVATTIHATLVGFKIVLGKLTMRTRLGVTVWLTLSLAGLAQKAPRRYTTLVIEYTGVESIRAVFPVIITTSQEEGEWYGQHLHPNDKWGFYDAGPYIQVVPQSVLDEITGLPLLKPALKRARMIEEHLPGKPEMDQNATFSAGVGHDYASITLDKQLSMKILKGVERIAAKYPSLKAELRQLEYHLK